MPLHDITRLKLLLPSADPVYKGACVNVIVDVSDVEGSKSALEFFGVRREEAPCIRGFDQSANIKYHPTPESLADGSASLSRPSASFFEQFATRLMVRAQQ